MGTARRFDALLNLRRCCDLLGKFRTCAKFLEPGPDARVQPRDWIARKRKPVGIDEPSDIENADCFTKQKWSAG